VQRQDDTDRKLRETCDVIILVCAASNENAMERVSSFWLPRFVSLGLKDIPVVLALSKFDEIDVPRGAHARRFANLVAQKRIATCIEVSARDKRNVADVFCWAQKAVTYPVAPLYDTTSTTLRDDYKKALVRIFRLCDRDGDDILNDHELRQFQRSVFGVDLSINDVHALKNALFARGEANLDNEQSGITFEGFCWLQRLFIEKNKMDTPWIMLRHFGYNNMLTLTAEYIPAPPRRKIDQAYELTSTDGMLFLCNTFQRFDIDSVRQIF
jgi:mitochondrial Rho GTPase 1